MNLSLTAPDAFPPEFIPKLEEFATATGYDLQQASHLVLAAGLAQLEAMTPEERLTACNSQTS